MHHPWVAHIRFYQRNMGGPHQILSKKYGWPTSDSMIGASPRVAHIEFYDKSNDFIFVFAPFVSHALHVQQLSSRAKNTIGWIRFTQRINSVNLTQIHSECPGFSCRQQFDIHDWNSLPFVKIWFGELSFQTKNLTYQNSMLGAFSCDPSVVAYDIIMQRMQRCPKPAS